MTKEPRTYTELLQAIGEDLKPRLKRSLYIPGPASALDEAIDSALNAGHTLELIAEFVGYRHVELLERHAKEQRPKANEQRDKKAAIWRARLTARIKDLEKELRDLRKEQVR